MEISQEYLYELLYEKDIPELLKTVCAATDSKLLHRIAIHYNWDNGTAVPECVTENPHCDLGTALLVFDLFGGYEYLTAPSESALSDAEQAFLRKLQKRITERDFQNHAIRYTPELTRTAAYSLRKACPGIDSIFLDGTDGEEIELFLV